MLLVAFSQTELAGDLLGTADVELEAPKFLRNVSPDAKVNSGILAILDGFLKGEGGERGLGNTIKRVAGDAHELFKGSDQEETHRMW